MVLDAEFASKLEETFGPVRTPGRGGHFPGSLNVQLPTGLARAIHSYWKRSLEDRLSLDALSDLTLGSNKQPSWSQATGSRGRPIKPAEKEYLPPAQQWDENTKPVTREEIDYARERRSEVFNKAAKAFKAKQGGVAAYYSEEGRDLNVKIQQMESAFRYQEFTRANQARVGSPLGAHSNSIDLHGLTVEEALESLAWFLDMKYDQLSKATVQTARLEIITGKGRTGKAKIRPAVAKYLKEEGLRPMETNGGGSYEVVIKKSQM